MADNASRPVGAADLRERGIGRLRGGTALSGGKHEATVAEPSKGAPSGDQITLAVVNVGDGAPSVELEPNNVEPTNVRLHVPLQVSDVLPKGVRAVSVEGSLVREHKLEPRGRSAKWLKKGVECRARSLKGCCRRS